MTKIPENTNNVERERIIDYAHKKFITEGFYKTSMDEIAQELHISKKTIYKHYSSKENLVEEVCVFRMNWAKEMIQEVLDSGDDAVTKFIKIINLNLTHFTNCSEKWLKDIQLHAPHCMKKFDDFRDAHVIKVMSRLLEQGRKEKLVENTPPSLLITAFIGALKAVTDTDFIMNNKFSLQQAFRLTSEMFLNGFLTPAGKEKYTKTKKLFEIV